jgi:hypothetical protein
VQKALERRSAAHTSAWARGKDDRPLLAIGRVPENAALYHRQKLQGGVYRSWPFAAVLEYDGGGKPRAFVDWFRRSKDVTDPGAWLVDPGVDYAGHHNAQVVDESDTRWSYRAVVDTPTDTHVGDTQWAVRARVTWQDGTRVQKGWWLRFHVALDRPEKEWWIEQTPLVDWRVEPEVRGTGGGGRGIVATAAVADPDRELAVLGTAAVFRFPEVPAGVTAATGRG